MNFNSPGWAIIAAVFCVLSLFTAGVRSQHESHEGSNGKNHLEGIRKLSIQRLSAGRPIQVPSQETRRYLTNRASAVVSAESLESRQWIPRRPGAPRRAPFAVLPVLDSRERFASSEREQPSPLAPQTSSRESVNYERRINMLPVNAHGIPTRVVGYGKYESRTGSSKSTEEDVLPVLTREEMERQRKERIQARWRKIGFRGRAIQSPSPYSQMRLVHYAHPISWTHAPVRREPTTETWTSAPTTPAPTTTTTKRSPPRTRPFLPEVIKPTKEETMIRRINKHPIHVESAVPQPAGIRPSFFRGKLLDEEEEVIVPPSKPITVSRSSETSFSESDGPSIVEDTSRNDYHSRSQNAAVPVRRFKLTNKLSYRPRLKIRRPEEQFAARGDANTNSYPLAIPELAPLDGRRPLPPTGFEEPTNAFMARHRVRPRPLPPAPIAEGEQNIQVEPPPPPSHVKPQVTGWGDEEDFSEVITEDSSNNGLASGGGGGSGAAFGGDIGTPPPGFQEAFGLNGASMALTTTVETTTGYTTTTRKATRRPTAPQPEEPFVVPENSGLRPVAPPREFTGGFGSAKGSSLSGFQGGGSGIGGGGAPPAPPPAPRPKKNRNRNPEPEYTEEQFFTGDSALVPNKRGPSGDGFGPPLPVDSNPPPPVPPISVGGGAAGIPQGMSGLRGYPDNENEATTVKPSALLSILNKADEGFNQAITHFERGTPVETAAIDILEVALGSQRLDSQAKLLGHVDRTFGLDNLQRLQRWANTGGAFDILKEQFAKMAKNYKVPEPTVTLPPNLEYLFAPSG